MRGVVVVVVLLLAVAQHAHGKALDSSEGPPLVSPLAFLLAERTGLKDRQGNPVLNKRYLPFVPNTTLHYKQTLQEFVQDQQDQQDQRRVKPPPVDRPAEGKYYLEATLKVRVWSAVDANGPAPGQCTKWRWVTRTSKQRSKPDRTIVFRHKQPITLLQLAWPPSTVATAPHQLGSSRS
jgi:hypothetical protein